MFIVKFAIALFLGALQCNAQSTNISTAEFNQRSEDAYCKSLEEEYNEEPLFACHDRRDSGWGYSDGRCVFNGRCNGRIECATGEDEEKCGTPIKCYSCSSVINVGGNYNLREECANGEYSEREKNQTCFNYCTLTVRALDQKWGQHIVVERGCDQLAHDEDKEVSENTCYDMYVPEDVEQLLSTGKYPGTSKYSVYRIQTCTGDFCNDRLGYELDLCGDGAVGALKSRISSAQSIVPSTFSYYLAIVLGYWPISELYGSI